MSCALDILDKSLLCSPAVTCLIIGAAQSPLNHASTAVALVGLLFWGQINILYYQMQ